MPPIRRVSGSTRSKSSSSTAYQLPQFVPPAPSSLARLLNPPSPMLASSALDAAYAPSLSYQPPSAPLESQLMHWEEASSGTEHDASGDDEDYKPTKEKRSRVTGKVQWIVKPSKPRSRLDSPFVPAGSTKPKTAKRKTSTKSAKTTNSLPKTLSRPVIAPAPVITALPAAHPATSLYPALSVPISPATASSYPFAHLLTGSSTSRIPVVPLTAAQKNANAAAALKLTLRQHFDSEEDYYEYARKIFLEQSAELGCARLPEAKRGKSGLRYLWCRGNRTGSMATSPEKKCRWGVYGKLIKDGSGNFTLGPAFPEHNPKYCLGLDASPEEVFDYAARSATALDYRGPNPKISKAKRELNLLNDVSFSAPSSSSSTPLHFSTPPPLSPTRSRSTTASSNYSSASSGTISSIGSSIGRSALYTPAIFASPGVSSPLAALTLGVSPAQMAIDSPSKQQMAPVPEPMQTESTLWDTLIAPLVDAVDAADALLLFSEKEQLLP